MLILQKNIKRLKTIHIKNLEISQKEAFAITTLIFAFFTTATNYVKLYTM